jgi:hypothetical protein
MTKIINPSFADMRELTNAKLQAKGFSPAAMTPVAAEALEGAGVTPEDLEKLQSDLARLIALESRKGLQANTVFFVLGVFLPKLIGF